MVDPFGKLGLALNAHWPMSQPVVGLTILRPSYDQSGSACDPGTQADRLETAPPVLVVAGPFAAALADGELRATVPMAAQDATNGKVTTSAANARWRLRVIVSLLMTAGDACLSTFDRHRSSHRRRAAPCQTAGWVRPKSRAARRRT